jgi:hypothetical protein
LLLIHTIADIDIFLGIANQFHMPSAFKAKVIIRLLLSITEYEIIVAILILVTGTTQMLL